MTDKLFSLTAHDRLPDFSGKIRYTFTFDLEAVPKGATLDLGNASETARVWINGKDLGIRIAAPFRYYAENALSAGRNTVTVEVSNTLAQTRKDKFSCYLQLKPTGLLGPLTLYSEA